MNFVPVLNQTIILFILMLTGYYIRKKGIISDIFTKDLSRVILNITLPALIITSMNHGFSPDIMQNFMYIIVLGIIIYAFLIAVALIFGRVLNIPQPSKGVYQFMIVFSNMGFMGYPILMAIYGEIGVFYGAAFNVLFNIVIWTFGVALVNNKNTSSSIKEKLKVIINPGIISVAIGLILFIFSLKLPYVIHTSLKYLGDTTTPLAMIVAGSLLVEADPKSILRNKTLLLTTLIRLIFIPLCIIGALWKLNIPDIVKGVLVIVNAMPVAANTAIFAQIYDSDYKLASEGIFITTLLSIITIPIITSLL